MNIVIRAEQPADSEAIFELTRVAFLTAAHSCQREQFVVNALRRSGDLALSLVAVKAARLVGHVAFSPVSIASGDAGWYGVGPLSVLPECQRQGIGTRLMQQGMATLMSLRAGGCVLVGDPAFYGRLGFSPCIDLTLPEVPPEYFLGRRFGDATAKGEVKFSAAFEATH